MKKEKKATSRSQGRRGACGDREEEYRNRPGEPKEKGYLGKILPLIGGGPKGGGQGGGRVKGWFGLLERGHRRGGCHKSQIGQKKDGERERGSLKAGVGQRRPREQGKRGGVGQQVVCPKKRVAGEKKMKK